MSNPILPLPTLENIEAWLRAQPPDRIVYDPDPTDTTQVCVVANFLKDQGYKAPRVGFEKYGPTENGTFESLDPEVTQLIVRSMGALNTLDMNSPGLTAAQALAVLFPEPLPGDNDDV